MFPPIAKPRLLALVASALTLLVPAMVPAQTTIRFPEMAVPLVKVTEIVPEFLDTERTLKLTAVLNHPEAAPHLQCLWRLEDSPGDDTLSPGDDGTARLVLGEEDHELTVSACLANGDMTGGCRRLTLKSELLEACMDERMWEEIENREWDDVICMGEENDALRYVFYKVSSRVNTVTGDYNREHVDLSVKVPGGELRVFRKYRNGRWLWEHNGNDLNFEHDESGGLVAILRGRIRYAAAADGSGRYLHRTYRIEREGDQWRWSDRNGRWLRYDANGRLAAFGNRSGLVGSYRYKNGNVAAMIDRNGDTRIHLIYNAKGQLSMVSDGASRWTGYQHRFGLLSEVTWADGSWRQFRYNKERRLSHILDPAGKEIRIGYDRTGKVASVSDRHAFGNFFSYRHDADTGLYVVTTKTTTGRIREVHFDKSGEARAVTINGRVVQKTERDGNRLVIADAAGNVTQKRFDDNENLLAVIHPDGSRHRFAYDPVTGRRTRFENGLGIITRFRHDAMGRLIEKIEAQGTPAERITRYEWDEHGQIIRIVACAGSHDETVTEMGYDANGSPEWIADPGGHLTRMEYDNAGNLIHLTDSTGAEWANAYDALGRKTGQTDPLGHTRLLEYDIKGNPIRRTDPLGRVTRFVHDLDGRLTRIFDPEGGDTRFAYDVEGRMTLTVDPSGVETRFGYDAMGRLAWSEDGAGNRIERDYGDPSDEGCASCRGRMDHRPIRIRYPTFVREFSYDAMGRLTRRSDRLPDGEALVARYAYDAEGRLITQTDPAGRTTRFEYDPLGRLVTRIDAMGFQTRFDYDGRDNLVVLTDANGNTTRFIYDRNDRLIEEISPAGRRIVNRYDPAGRLIEKEDPTGRRELLSYDDAGRLIRVRYFMNGNADAPDGEVEFTHDAVGNLLSYADRETSGRYRYDSLNRRIEETVDYGPFALTNRYGYHENGLPAAFTGPEGETYAYTYDAGNRLAEIEMPTIGSIVLSDYDWNRPTRIAYPGDGKRELAFDALQRIRSIRDLAPSGKPVMDYRFTYDIAGNVTSKETEHGRYDYQYDPLNRLVSAMAPEIEERFTYDPVGNRLSSSDSKSTWNYSPDNELLGYDDVAFAYDEAGNTIRITSRDNEQRFEYNAGGRLQRVENGSGETIAEYAYDPFGRRLWKSVNGRRVYFHYSDQGLAAEYDEDGNLIQSYIWKPGGLWGTDPFAMKKQGRYHFYHNDHIGTPQQVTSETGEVVWSARYASFGAVMDKREGGVVNNFRFGGQYYDRETGLRYNFHRYYNSGIGRYLKRDPIGLLGGINLYTYTSNNPVNFIDPSGFAQFGYRPLDSLGFIPPGGVNAFDDQHNTEWVHEQLWFDDTAENPNLRTNVGFFGDNGMWNEPGKVREDTGHTRGDYTFRGPTYDDEIMRRALGNIEGLWDGSNYNVATENNCQDFSDALRHEYLRLGGIVTWPVP